VERNVPHDGHLWIEALDKVTPNAQVATAVDDRRFIDLVISRLAGK
jgi:hypothetical protein